MAGETYSVVYNIRVNDQASRALQSFTDSVAKLQGANTELTTLNQTLTKTMSEFRAMSKKAPTLRINTGTVNRQLDTIIGKLNKIKTLAGESGVGLLMGSAAGKGGKVVNAPTKQESGPTNKPAVSKQTPNKLIRNVRTGNLKNNVLGKTLIDTGGVGVFDFLKGMGIAYGISGLGTLIGNVVRDSADYNNIIQTTKNILGTHDLAPNFAGRFSGMEQLVRRVGMETKFTAPQVADATKFLAMAGFDLNAIEQSIRPIADIALIGDNDLGETADVVTNIMTGYGIRPEGMRHAADVMTMTFTKSNTTLMEIAESYKYAAALLAKNGTSFEEATAAIGILGDAGIKGSQAGTTLRTLALNIAKPTKKQAEMWGQIGVSRTDSNGNLRDLVDIFQDLNTKNLTVEQFGQLFHKTAVSGAASLAANVDKWNEIIRLNFLSDGVTNKLANEKKNTIQGLWYQITSSFTEAGMQAFESQESMIRDVMTKFIGWLQSETAVEKIKNFGNAIINVGETLVKFTKTIGHLYEKFEPLILLWLKTQIYLKAALIPARIINSVLDLAKGFTALSMAMGGVGVRAAGLGASGGMIGTLVRFVSTTNKIAHLDPAVAARYKSIYGYSPWIGKFGPFASGITKMAGGIGGAYLGASLDQSMGGNGLWGSILGGLGGTAAGSFLPKIIGMIPGWGQAIAGIAAAIGGLVFWVNKHNEKVQNAVEANKKWADSLKIVNGINMSSAASTHDKYLQLVLNKQLSANEALAEYIRLKKEELGLVEKSPTEDKTPLKNLNEFAEEFKNAKLAIQAPWGDGETSQTINGVTFKSLMGASWNTKPRYEFNKMSGAYSDVNSAYQAAIFLSNMGREDAYQKAQDYIAEVTQATSLGEVDMIRKKWLLEMTEMENSIATGSKTWSLKAVGNQDLATNQKGYHYITEYIKTVNDALYSNPLVLTWMKILEYFNVHGKDAILPLDLQQEFFANSGVSMYDPSKYGVISNEGDLGSYYSRFGWSSDGYTGSTIFDGSGKALVVTKQDAKLTSEGALADMEAATGKMDPKFHGALSLLNLHRANMPSTNQTAANNNLAGQGDILPGGNGGGGGGEHYPNPYKSSSSATPKQISINIGSLMNVESIDMTNPNNQYIVDKLKDQLSQALLDVVSDFSISAGNLA